MMEISNHTLLKSGWQGNTFPMVWNTFWVPISDLAEVVVKWEVQRIHDEQDQV